MRKVITLLTVSGLLCLFAGCMQYRAEGVGPATVSAEAGEEVYYCKNFWRGGVVGGTLEAVPNVTAADISSRALRQSAAVGRLVEYRTEDGGALYRAEPLSYDQRTKCKKIREQFWTNNNLIRTRTKEICNDSKPGKDF